MKKLTEECKTKISEGLRGNTNRRKEIECYDLEGNYLRTYHSATEAGEDLGYATSNISQAALGRLSHLGEYRFRYTREIPERKIEWPEFKRPGTLKDMEE